ncbi:MAG TPA: SprT family zinc-dependent metalloprotease [Candidatus Woesebacteria bacterium]|nr:SprT family zinc-dependent metalloprotease [Candidatus Woesebacteria bacterium]
MNYTLKRSARTRSLSIKISPSGRVLVSAPFLIPKFVIDQFVYNHQDWIETNIAKQKKRQNLVNTADFVQIFGQSYQKTNVWDPHLPIGISISQKKLLINFPDQKIIQSKTRKQELTFFLKQTARTYFHQRVPQLAKKMAVSYTSLTLRAQKTRWGSCSSTNSISLNWRLIHYPPPVIDYVIVHELAHLTHHNHSAQFWALVAKYDDSYQEHRQYLKKKGVALDNE